LSTRRILWGVLVGVAVALGPTSTAVAMPGDSGTSSPTKVATLVPAWDQDLPAGEAAVPHTATGNGSGDVGTLASWVCTVYASDVDHNGTYLAGNGWQSCAGSGYTPAKIDVKIQRSRWYGWETMSSASGNWEFDSWQELWTYYECTGTGTHDFRVVSTGYAAGGAYSQSVQSLNYLRINCGG
jgi:hypothetical protein